MLSFLFLLLLIYFYVKRDPVSLIRLFRYMGTLDSDPVCKEYNQLSTVFVSNRDKLLLSFWPLRRLVLSIANFRFPGLCHEVMLPFLFFSLSLFSPSYLCDAQILGRGRLWDQELKNLCKKNQVAGKRGRFSQLVVLSAGHSE